VDIQEVQDAFEGFLDDGLPEIVDRLQKVADALEETAQPFFSDEGWRDGSGDWIVAALGKWMAPSDPHRPHPPAAQPAIPLNRLIRVVGTGRVVAAGRRKDF